MEDVSGGTSNIPAPVGQLSETHACPIAGGEGVREGPLWLPNHPGNQAVCSLYAADISEEGKIIPQKVS